MKSEQKAVFLLLAAFFVFPVEFAARAEDEPWLTAAIVVDPLNGNDLIAGRYALPFQTVTNATKAALNGDTIYIRNTATNYVQSLPGDGSGYFEALWHFESLTNVYVTGDPGVILQQVNLTTVWGEMVTHRATWGLTFNGLTFIGDTNSPTSNQPFGQPGADITGCLMAAGRSSRLTVRNCNFFNWPDQAISHLTFWEESADDGLVENCYFNTIGCTNITGWVLPADGDCVSGLMGNNFVIRNNTARNVQGFVEAGYGGDANQPDFVPKRGLIIEGNYATNIYVRCVAVGGVAPGGGWSDVTIQNNEFHLSANSPITGGQGIWITGGTNYNIIGNHIHSFGWNYPSIWLDAKENDIDLVNVDGNSIVAEEYAQPSIEVGRFSLSGYAAHRVNVTGNTLLQPGHLVAIVYGAEEGRIDYNHIWNINYSSPNFPVIMLLNGTNSAQLAPMGFGICTNVSMDGNIYDGVVSPGYFVASKGSLPVSTLYFGSNNVAWNGAPGIFLLDTNGITTLVLPPDGPDPFAKPEFLSQPAEQIVRLSESALFLVHADGPLPIRYQWLFNGHPIQGATNSFFLLDSVESANVGAYTAVVGNQWGNAISQAASLTQDASAPPDNTNDPPSLSFTGMEMMDVGGLLVSLAGTNLHVVDIEWSSNCQAWFPFQTLSNSGGIRYFSDPDAPTQSRRFYRAIARP